MYWTRFSRSTRTLLYSMSCLSIVALALWFGASNNSVDASSDRTVPEGGMSFPGSGGGPIPDGGPGCGAPAATNVDVTFPVTGVSSISNVAVDIDITHTWVGDVTATLIAPSGESLAVFQNVGWTDTSSACGDSSDLGAVYQFKDTAATNFWAAAGAIPGGSTIAGGEYRTTEAGGATQTMNPAPVTSLDMAFENTATINGTWTLRFNDSGGGDTGTVAAPTSMLTFNGGVVNTQPPDVDFDGDGESDYSIVRNDTPAASGSSAPAGRRSIEQLNNDPGFKPIGPASTGNTPENHGTNLGWYIHNSSNNTARVQGFGEPTTDFWVPQDFDGDGQDDLAVWRGVAPSGPMGGFFYTFTSSNSTVNEIDFGQIGDNPTVVGDYDGDGMADPAVHRCPPNPGGQCTFFYMGSAGSGITFFDWGNNSSGGPVRPYPGDFDGDGAYDFATFQDGIYSLFRSSDGGTEFIAWGLATDAVLAPGDYDGDGKTDLMNVRVNGSDVEWWALMRDGSQRTTIWGAVGIAGFSEFAAQGDFDGDGATDLGIWRRDNGSTSNSFFYTLRSSDSMFEAFEWGSSGDAPVPGWNGN